MITIKQQIAQDKMSMNEEEINCFLFSNLKQTKDNQEKLVCTPVACFLPTHKHTNKHKSSKFK